MIIIALNNFSILRYFKIIFYAVIANSCFQQPLIQCIKEILCYIILKKLS